MLIRNHKILKKDTQLLEQILKKSKKGFIWWFSGTVAALLLIGLFLTMNQESASTKPIISKEDTTNHKTDLANKALSIHRTSFRFLLKIA